MEFKELLTGYMEQIGITRGELALRSGLSPSTVSRYSSGFRSPDFLSDRVDALLRALADCAREKGVAGVELSSLRREAASIMVDSTAVERFRANLNDLLDQMDVHTVEFSRYMCYDPSYISRIRSGQRRPAKLEEFASDSAAYFLQREMEPEQRQTLSELIGLPSEELNSTAAREALARWILQAERG